MIKKRVLLSWSSGKDSAWTLHALRAMEDVDVVGLITTYNEQFSRVAMHAVRLELLRIQAEAVGVPLLEVPLPWPCTNEQYEAAMQHGLARAREEMQPTHLAFGDLWLEDVRSYRETLLASSGFDLLFPLWGIPTRELAASMVAGGLRAFVTCVDPRLLAKSFAGRMFDDQFLKDLPEDVDPCAEQGEFHTFAVDGPMFNHPLAVTVGEIVERDGFVFADILDAGTNEV